MFYIIEIQKNDQGQYAHLITTATTQRQAESVYYDKLHYAAVSELPVYSVTLLTEYGERLMSHCYRSDIQE